MRGTTCLARVYFGGGRGCSCAAESPNARARTVGYSSQVWVAQWPFLQHRFLLAYHASLFLLFHTSHVLYSTYYTCLRLIYIIDKLYKSK